MPIAFQEDLTIFLDDFSVPVVVAGRPAGSGIYDGPGQYIGPDGRTQQADPQVRCLATLVDGLVYGDIIKVDGTYYEVRDNLPLYDGVWRQVFLNAATARHILLEDGGSLLMEDGNLILLEN